MKDYSTPVLFASYLRIGLLKVEAFESFGSGAPGDGLADRTDRGTDDSGIDDFGPV